MSWLGWKMTVTTSSDTCRWLEVSRNQRKSPTIDFPQGWVATDELCRAHSHPLQLEMWGLSTFHSEELWRISLFEQLCGRWKRPCWWRIRNHIAYLLHINTIDIVRIVETENGSNKVPQTGQRGATVRSGMQGLQRTMLSLMPEVTRRNQHVWNPLLGPHWNIIGS